MKKIITILLVMSLLVPAECVFSDVCRNCGAEVSENENFCGECGTAVSHYCSSCGYELPADAKFCPNCGTAAGSGNSSDVCTDETDLSLRNAGPGDTITFGSYEQDNNFSNGMENIDWIILERDDDKILVISKYALDCQQYYPEYVSVTWETSTMRAWLNETFYNTAFDEAEKDQILTTTVPADTNADYGTEPGNDTLDKVFLLSLKEAEKYFDSNEERRCSPSAYALANEAYTNGDCLTAEGNASCWWWLRSPGDCSQHAAGVHSDGSVDYQGNGVYSHKYDCVRPAIWIRLDVITAESDDAESTSSQAENKVIDAETSEKKIITFGTYRQHMEGGSFSNEKTAIEWIVLAEENGRKLLLSRYVLDCQPYHTAAEDVTWENSSLRKWLNEDFLNTSFSPEEQAAIQAVSVSADPNSNYESDPGSDTTDQVFLLSMEEAEKYLVTDDDRKCEPTDYAEYMGVFPDAYFKGCYWWLRTPGSKNDRAVDIDCTGAVDSNGYGVSNSDNGVRPAIWITQ